MSVKAVVLVRNIGTDIPPSPTGFTIGLGVVGMESGNELSKDLFLTGVDPTILSLTLEQAIKNAVRSDLITNHGYSFGIFDTVRLITALV